MRGSRLGHRETGTGLCPVPALPTASPASGATSFSQDDGRTEGPSVLWAWPSARGFTRMKETVLVHKLQWEEIERSPFPITLILAPFSWDGRNLPHRDPRGTCLRSRVVADSLPQARSHLGFLGGVGSAAARVPLIWT